ncbi:HTTM domain-containing protein [Flavobacterium sp. RHBU_24]|uniref:HTTM domain-containing protein n=1 Tax=Flavobacterium sp. RHBU_24 TaxID=3391185 RepID=UPI003984CDB9
MSVAAYLNKRVDNAPLVLFRICFGFLLAWQSFYDIYDDKIYVLYVEPKHHFPFLGFEWVHPLPGYGMYIYHIVMGILGLCICAGLLYRYSLTAFTLLWGGLYVMQKTSYNNHHYLIILLCLLMLVVPANRYASIDCRLKPALKKYSMPQWCRVIIIVQVFVLYFFAGVAKLYPDWMDGSHMGLVFKAHQNPAWLFITQNHWFHLFISWGGIVFDLLIIPALLYNRTRLVAAAATVFFHLFNFYTLNIGIFPFLSIAFLPFFFSPEKTRQLVFPKKPPVPADEATHAATAKNNAIIKYILFPYVIIQLFLPLRPYLIEGNVFYTEEGSRLAWRMKLTLKSGRVTFRVAERPQGKQKIFNISNLYTPFQIYKMSTKPDMIWQAAQLIKQEYAKKGKDVSVYVTAYVKLNNHPERLIIDPKADLAAAKWDYFFHNEWILLNED